MRPFEKVAWISVIIVVFLAIMDVQGLHMFQNVGGFCSETYSKMEDDYQTLFWTFSYVLIGVVALVYYFVRKDKSETLALVLLPLILLWSGIEDILYYIFGQFPFVGVTMPWLYENCWFMRWVAEMMGQTTVTSTTLIASSALGVIIAYYIYKYLEREPW